MQGDTRMLRDAPVASSVLGMRAGGLGMESTAMGLLGACLLLGGSCPGVFGEQTKYGTRALWVPWGQSLGPAARAVLQYRRPGCSGSASGWRVPKQLSQHGKAM